jgi:hypothetical protein
MFGKRIPTGWKIYAVVFVVIGIIWVRFFYFSALRHNPSIPHWDAAKTAILSFVALNAAIWIAALLGRLWDIAARRIRRARGRDNYF